MPRKLRGPTLLRREADLGRPSESEFCEADHALVSLPAEGDPPEAHAISKVHLLQHKELHNDSPDLAHLRESIFVLSLLRELVVAGIREHGTLFPAGRR